MRPVVVVPLTTELIACPTPEVLIIQVEITGMQSMASAAITSETM